MRAGWPERLCLCSWLMVSLLGCENVCDEVAEEAEASGCAGTLPADEESLPEAATKCEGSRERRAECLLDFSENVCFLSDEELQAIDACVEGAPGS